MISLAGLGRPSVVAALAFCAVSLVLSAAGALLGRRDVVEAGRRALGAATVFTAGAAVALTTALAARDFSLEYVASYTSRSLSPGYSVGALWGGMEGSLVLWTLLLMVFATAALRRTPRDAAAGWAAAVLAGVGVFFLALLAAPADPFTRLATPPADGSGLNPLLQSPGMLVHPPLLYAGFVGFSVPFAFAMGALLAGRVDDGWFTATRRWTLAAWSALSIGIVLGGAWAYTELGWGGYWAWDPVENASFLPWLTATAFLHSVIIQEKRRMLKVWNVTLIVLTYVLAVFGTFLTRSGILSSIHTFTEGPIGRWFLPFLALLLLGGLGVVALRLDRLRGDAPRLDSMLSREAAFVANNVLFVAAAFAVLWGTLYPIVNEALTGIRVSVGPPFFNAVFAPLGLAILALSGLGPLVSWRRMRARALRRIVTVPVAAAAGAALAGALAGVSGPGALVAFALCAFTAASIAGEFARGSRVHRARDGLPWGAALARTVARNRRRYGGYVVHLGVVLVVVGIGGSAFRTERQALLDPGDSLVVGGYSLVYEGLERATTDEKQVFAADVAVLRDGREVTRLRPQRNFHVAQQQWQSEIALRTTPVEDLYVVVTSFDRDGSAAIRAFVNPLTWWIWAGAAVMAAGMAVLLAGRGPATAERPAPARRPEPVVAVR